MTKKLALFIIFIKIMVASSETVTLEQLLKSGLENNNLIILKEKSLNSQIKDIEILKSTVKPKISLDLSYDIYKNENVIGNPWIKNYVLSEDKVGIYLILKFFLLLKIYASFSLLLIAVLIYSISNSQGFCEQRPNFQA